MEKNSNIKVCNLFIYPIKSCHEIEMQHSIVTRHGLLNDRKLVMIRKKDLSFISMRTHPKIYSIKTTIDDIKPELYKIYIPNLDKEFIVDTTIHTSLNNISIKIWDISCFVTPIDKDNISSELSKYINDEVILVKPVTERKLEDFPKNYNYKLINTKPNDSTYFADLAPILIISMESFNYVNNLVKETGEELQLLNFRPNIVLQGGDKEFWENNVQRLKIGNLIFRRIKGCDRCKVTTFDLKKKEFRKSNQPLEVLNDVSYDDILEGVVFGQNFCVDVNDNDKNIINVNDEVNIIE
jgi:uncharacterized protein YcbX